MVELSIVNSRSDAGAIMCPNWRNRNQNRFAARALQVQPLPQGHAVWPTTGFFEGARLERGPGSAAAFPLAPPASLRCEVESGLPKRQQCRPFEFQQRRHHADVRLLLDARDRMGQIS